MRVDKAGAEDHEGIQVEVSHSPPRHKLIADASSPYDILDLPVTATEAEVKKQYRKKSLLIHPDKFKHEHAEQVRLSLPFFLETLLTRPLRRCTGI